jgi:hypothetical protein
LDVHGGFAGLASALAINAVLAGEDKGVGEQVEGNGKAAALDAHAELMLFKRFAVVFPNGHASS